MIERRVNWPQIPASASLVTGLWAGAFSNVLGRWAGPSRRFGEDESESFSEGAEQTFGPAQFSGASRWQSDRGDVWSCVLA